MICALLQMRLYVSTVTLKHPCRLWYNPTDGTLPAVFVVSLIFSDNSILYTGSGYCDFAIWFMTWWNSFGYDWLFMDIGRQLLFGALVITLIFRGRGDVFRWIEVGKRG